MYTISMLQVHPIHQNWDFDMCIIWQIFEENNIACACDHSVVKEISGYAWDEGQNVSNFTNKIKHYNYNVVLQNLKHKTIEFSCK